MYSHCASDGYVSKSPYVRWSKREEQDFGRVIAFFGVVHNRKANKYDWTKFR